jgi:hypothetical protein
MDPVAIENCNQLSNAERAYRTNRNPITRKAYTDLLDKYKSCMKPADYEKAYADL